MGNQENMTTVIDMLKQITNTLSQNQSILFEQYKSLNEKFDSLNGKYDSLNEKYDSLNGKYDSLNEKYDSLNGKFDSLNEKYDSLNKKVDRYYEENRAEHIEIRNTISNLEKNMQIALSNIQKDIKDLRTDIDTVYDLEKDSRNQIRKLL